MSARRTHATHCRTSQSGGSCLSTAPRESHALRISLPIGSESIQPSGFSKGFLEPLAGYVNRTSIFSIQQALFAKFLFKQWHCNTSSGAQLVAWVPEQANAAPLLAKNSLKGFGCKLWLPTQSGCQGTNWWLPCTTRGFKNDRFPVSELLFSSTFSWHRATVFGLHPELKHGLKRQEAQTPGPRITAQPRLSELNKKAQGV